MTAPVELTFKGYMAACGWRFSDMRCIARLDYDSHEALREGVGRMRFVLMLAESRQDTYAMRRHRTVRGWHVELFAMKELQPAESVALQAILGSDFRREAFNLYRVMNLPGAPSFWRTLSHWNILHAEKLT